MRILDNKKDYYDYLVGTYGEDPLLFYDRRGSERILSQLPPDHILPIGYKDELIRAFMRAVIVNDSSKEFEDGCICLTGRFTADIPRKLTTKAWQCCGWLHRDRSVWKKNEIYEGNFVYFMLEVGMFHYYFEVERYIDPDKGIRLSPLLIKKERIPSLEDRLRDEPVSLIFMTYNHMVSRSSYWRKMGKVEFEPQTDVVTVKGNKNVYKGLVNPILKETFIPQFIPAEDMWLNITEYLGLIKEKPFKDGRTDVQKLESAGFDKKTSFRKM